MSLLIEKFKEVVSSVLPIVGIVLVLAIFFVDVSGPMLTRFGIGAVLVILGLTIFLFGIDVGMGPIGEEFGHSVAISNSKWFVAIISFLVGFTVTVAEPDLLILGQQISDATGGALSANLIVYVVSFGVAFMVSFGIFRILANFSIKKFFTIVYGIIFILALFASSEFLAMAFDASGATTGALTTPFILALGASVSSRAGGEHAEDNSFGLVGTMSTGPILGVLILAIITGATFEGGGSEYEYAEGIISPFIGAIGSTFMESLIALIPIMIFFIIMNFFKFKLDRKDLGDIFKGILYTLLGLTIFLLGVNEGFMDMGRFLGTELATNSEILLPIIGLIMGLVVVLAEPAVHSLGDQVEDVTGGFISNRLLLGALSIGVGLAVGLSMLRIMIPGLQLWHILLPGFAIAIGLSYFVDDLFTGIAFDAGGVASGPMTATFITAFGQGAASALPQADVLLDGFGVIATVAMVPVVMIQLLGAMYKIRTKREEA